MEVQKRVQLKTFDKPKEVDVVKPIKLAIRFEIKLEESTDDKCPEISYADLLLKHELKRKRTSSASNSILSNPDVLDADNTDNLEALAKQMEEKYGKSYGGLSRGRNIDLGDGYDTEDSFIDNEEAYDELVPSSLTTKHGGFYINTGVLDFKEVSDDEIVSDNELKPKKKKKKVLSSSDSEADKGQAKETVKRKRKKNLSASSADSANKKTLLAKKRKKMLTSSEKLDKDRIKKKKIMLKKKKLVERAQLKLSDKELNCKAKQYESLIDDVINCPISLGSQPAASAASGEQVSASSEPPKGREHKSEPVKLPGNLSEACLWHIDSLKQAGGRRGDEKSKFFTNDINNQLTSLDIEVRKISSLATRNAIYSHLSTFLPINRETLMKRMKLLRQKELTNKLHGPIEDLKSAINEVMPAQIEKYNQESLARQASKLEDTERQREDTQDSEDDASTPLTSQLSVSAAGSTQPLATSTTADPSAASTQEEKKKERAAPCRKKFEWTEKVRERLLMVITIKMESYDILKTKGQTADDHLKEFLESEIRILWPKGWMQSRVLYRESKSAHVKWTNPSTQTVASKPAVQKKPALITNALKMATSISTKKSTQTVKNTTAKDVASKLVTLPSSTAATESKDNKVSSLLPSATHKPVVKSAVSAHKSFSEAGASNPVQLSLSPSKSITDHFMSQERFANTNLYGTTVKTIRAGEKIVMDGNKVIGRLVPSSSKNPTAALVADKKDVITLWDTPSTGSTESTYSKTFHTVNMKSAASMSNHSKSSTFPTNQSKVDDDIHLITLPDSLTPSKASASTELSLGSVANRKQNISAAQSEQATTALAFQAAQALHQKHLTASLVGQQAMLQHKKLADSLATQQKVAKQKHIAAIAAEQKANASKATQQRMAQQVLAGQQKLAQIQQQKAAQQKIIPTAQQKSAQDQHKLTQAQQQKLVQEQNKLAQAHKHKLTLAQQQMLGPAPQQKKLTQSQQQKAVQHKLVHEQQHHLLAQKIAQEQQKMTQAQQQKLAQAQQQKLAQVQQQKLAQAQQQKLAQVQQQKLAHVQQQKLAQMQIAQRSQMQHQQSRQQMSTQQLVQSPPQSMRYSAHGISSQPNAVPQRMSPSASSTTRGTTPTIVSTPATRTSLVAFPYSMPGSTTQSPESPSAAGVSPSWPVTSLQQLQQQQQMAADYRRFLPKMEEK